MFHSVQRRTRQMLTRHKVTGLAFLLLIVVTIFIINLCELKPKGSNNLVVVIDAGHGGNDPGKIGCGGEKEKDINLQIALKLKDELQQRGVTVIMTRESDQDLATSGATNRKRSDMENRVALANDSSADYLVSIHQNSYSSSQVKGAQTFYYGTSADSRKLAEAIQKNLIEQVDTSNTRAAAQGNDYYILRRSKCPAVIVECGFLSNMEETAKLTNEDYQQKIAKAIADAICEQ
ncbi:MAG: N-acetylmuramoyl-L-alanine amidase CwlD [Wujia sp.]